MMSEMVKSVDGAQVLNLAGEGPCKTLTSNVGDHVIRWMVLLLSLGVLTVRTISYVGFC
jgi:hypothetical protein